MKYILYSTLPITYGLSTFHHWPKIVQKTNVFRIRRMIVDYTSRLRWLRYLPRVSFEVLDFMSLSMDIGFILFSTQFGSPDQWSAEVW
jgi:hypothetical protein